MQQNEKPRYETGASEALRLGSANASEVTPNTRNLQVRRLMARFGLSPVHAGLVAELAFVTAISSGVLQ